MATCDRLRTQALQQGRNTSSAGSTTSCTSHQSSADAFEIQRMHTALKELRNCCRSIEALHSFGAFETQIKQAFMRTGISGAPRSNQPLRLLQDDVDVKQTSPPLWNTAASCDTDSATDSGRELEERASASVQPKSPVPNVLNRTALTKSKTTSNLVTLPLDGHKDQQLARSTQVKKSVPSPSQKHRRRNSYIPVSSRRRHTKSETEKQLPESYSKAAAMVAAAKHSLLDAGYDGRKAVPKKSPMQSTTHHSTSRVAKQEDEQVPQSSPMPSFRPPPVRQTSSGSNITLVDSSELPSIADPGPSPSSISAPRCLQGYPSSTGGIDARGKGASYKIPDASNLVPSEIQEHRKARTNAGVVDGHRLRKNKRKSHTDRQSSGEFVKTLLDAGLTQVKKMGRRVSGSVSWTSSSEDLTTIAVRK